MHSAQFSFSSLKQHSKVKQILILSSIIQNDLLIPCLCLTNEVKFWNSDKCVVCKKVFILFCLCDFLVSRVRFKLNELFRLLFFSSIFLRNVFQTLDVNTSNKLQSLIKLNRSVE